MSARSISSFQSSDMQPVYGSELGGFLAKIAVELEKALAKREATGIPGTARERILAQGPGWRVADVVCTSGPQDRPFEERHTDVSIAMVVAGTFQYRSSGGRELMTPGSLLLGSAGSYFECAHQHAEGDRCISFRYAPEYFSELAAESEVPRASSEFCTPRLPPIRKLSPITARACAALGSSTDGLWEELSIQLAVQTLALARDCQTTRATAPPRAEARVTEVVRTIERNLDADLRLATLARKAELSPYHFLRIFERITGVTPHQYVLRARLRDAALRLAQDRDTVLDTALDSGFGDLSNFNRAFRAEFGVSPRRYRSAQFG